MTLTVVERGGTRLNPPGTRRLKILTCNKVFKLLTRTGRKKEGYNRIPEARCPSSVWGIVDKKIISKRGKSIPAKESNNHQMESPKGRFNLASKEGRGKIVLERVI